MARLNQWQSALAQCIADRRRRPFEWGRHDCCIFAADCVLAVTGQDFAAGLRGSYSTEAEAELVLRRMGGVVDVAVDHLGPVVPTALARTGDVGLHTRGPGERPALAVYGGGGIWLAAAPRGLAQLEPRQIARAWRVG